MEEILMVKPNDSIFTISTMEKIPDNRDLPDYGDIRAVGFFHSYEDAEIRLHENTLDLHECIYNYAVLEELMPGLYPKVVRRQFFKYDKAKDGYVEIPEPEILKSPCGVDPCGYAMG